MDRETELLCEIHEGLPRQGPGSNECTERALRMIPSIPENPLILDVGCGSGAQTIELVRLGCGRVIGLDIHEPFLRDLQKRSEALKITGSAEAVCGSMFDMPFKGPVFDIIWSEGAMYIMGFERGLNSFHGLLKPKGFMALTELVWLRDDPPEELSAFWQRVYPDMKYLEKNVEIITASDFTEIGHFALPQKSWWNYYDPLGARLAEVRDKYAGDVMATAIIDDMLTEISLYRRYAKFYGYVFYIMQKNI